MTQHKTIRRITAAIIASLAVAGAYAYLTGVNLLYAQFPPQPPLPLQAVLQVNINPVVRICPKGKTHTTFNISLVNTSISIINATMTAVSNKLNVNPVTTMLTLPPGPTNTTLYISGFGPLPLTNGQIQVTFTAPPFLGSISRSAHVIIIPVEKFLSRSC